MIHTLQVAVFFHQDIFLTRLETDADPEEAQIWMSFPWQLCPVSIVLSHACWEMIVLKIFGLAPVGYSQPDLGEVDAW